MSTVPNHPDAPESAITPDQLVADALERAATDLLHQAEDLDGLPLGDVYRRSALAVTAMRIGLSDTPAATLTAAVEVARSRYDGADVLAARILAGDAEALAEGQRWQREANRVTAAFERFGSCGGNEERLLGVVPVVDAVLVAIGEQPSSDPEVHARFKPTRLAFSRRATERLLACVDEDAASRPLSANEERIREQCRVDLDLIAQGVEPS